MPKTPLPFDPELPERDPKQRARIVARASRLRRAAGEPLTPTGRLPRRPYADIVFMVSKHDATVARDRAERPVRNAVRRALPAIVRALRVLHDVPVLPLVPHPRGALARRRYRLLALKPVGATPDVWAEIVDYAGCKCLACGAPASRAGHLEDGTPFPACFRHALCSTGAP